MVENYKEEYSFCKINCIHNYSEIDFKSDFLKNICLKNKKVLFWYISKFRPFYFKESLLGGFKGIEIFMPICKEDIVYNKDFYYYLLGEAKETLHNIDSKLSYLETINEIFPDNVENAKLKLVFLEDALSKIKEKSNQRKSKVMYVLGEDDFASKVALFSSIENDMEAYIYTINSSGIVNEFVDYIYEETGMYINIINNKKFFVETLKECDIVVNLNKEDLKLTHKLKVNSHFIDVTNKCLNGNNIAKHRDDVKVVTDIEFTMKGKLMNMQETHKVLNLLDDKYNHFINGKEFLCNSNYLYEKYKIKLGDIK